jgi:uncharacterized membrane protein
MEKLKKLSIIVLAIIVLSIGISSTVTATNPYLDDYYGTDPETAGAFFGMAMLTCAIIAIIWFVIWILVAIWVYKDAEKRGSSGILWLILVILLGIIGIIIWLVIRPPIGGHPNKQSDQGRKCPSCGRPIPMDASVCPYCGKDFRPK